MTSTLNEEDFDKENYGIIPLIQSADKHDRQLLPIRDINETLIKQIVWIRGRGRQYFFYYPSSIRNNSSCYFC